VLIDIHRSSGGHCDRLPALVVSPERYNRRSGLALMCAVSPQAKGYPFEVRMAVGAVEGVVLADHLRSTDWQARHAEVLGRVPARVVADVLAKLKPL
jgi:mRNA interferase MazF